VPAGASHAAIAPYGPFRTRETDVVLAIQNDREWVAFCEQVLRRPDLTRDERFGTGPARVTYREQLRAEIEAVFATLAPEELAARLTGARIAHARRNGLAELIEHPQLAERGRWTEVGSPVGPLAALIPPVTVRAAPPARMDPIPALGQHTESLLAELGYPPDEISALRAAAAI
jgi:crotonobetainyl-CoA:carnitine CoA-transferase CaiB-like acyl-CoA transferase